MVKWFSVILSLTIECAFIHGGFVSADDPAAGHGNPRPRAPRSKVTRTSPPDSPATIRTGFSGHFACQAFTGLDRKLSIAISEEKQRQAAWLIQDGANINARSKGLLPRDMTMLQVAIWYRWSIKSINILLNSGADANARDALGNTPLIYATRDQAALSLELVEQLRRHGAAINTAGAKRMTPLMYAALYSDSPELVSMLLHAGADVTAADQDGWTALMHATRARHDSDKIAKILLAAGAQVNRTHRGGGTALMSACLHGNARCAQMLIQADAHVNGADESGWTPLLCATMSGNIKLVDLLLLAGANTNQQDRLGRNALFLAGLSNNTPIVDRLKQEAREHAPH